MTFHTLGFKDIEETLTHSAKKWFFSSILIFAKEKFPQFIHVKRQMQAGLKEYPSSSLNTSANLIQYKNLLNHYWLLHKNTFLEMIKEVYYIL